MNESVLRSIGVREGSATWLAIEYMLRKNVPMSAASRAFQIPFHRLEPAWIRYQQTIADRRTDARNTWAAAQNLTIEEFEKWWISR